MQHFVTDTSTNVHNSVTKWCIVGYGINALRDLCNISLEDYLHTFHGCFNGTGTMTIRQACKRQENHINQMNNDQTDQWTNGQAYSYSLHDSAQEVQKLLPFFQLYM